MIEWKPWLGPMPEVPKLDIEGPPCKNCIHWNPQPHFVDGHKGCEIQGVKLCHADEMFNDFSCFKERE